MDNQSPTNESNSYTNKDNVVQQAQKSTDPRPQKKFIKAVLISVIALSIGAVAFVVFLILNVYLTINSEISDCSNGRDQLFGQTESITKEFNSIEFIPGQTIIAKIEKQQGDCVDSLPTIFGTRTFNITGDAGTAFDAMSQALTSNGYTQQQDDYPVLNPCSYEDRRYTFTKANRKIDITLTCANTVSKGQPWRGVPVTKATAYLDVSWEYPTK